MMACRTTTARRARAQEATMAIFHHHQRDEDQVDAPRSFEVLGSDGVVRRYARDAFDMIVESTDPAEVQREVEHGWAILDERPVTRGGRGPSGDDLIVGIEGLRVGGVLGYEKGETVTRYTIGYLRDGADPLGD
jgi:hypothetical protein